MYIVDVKVVVVDYYNKHYCTRGLFAFSMRTMRTFIPKVSFYIMRWKYELSYNNELIEKRKSCGCRLHIYDPHEESARNVVKCYSRTYFNIVLSYHCK